MFVFSDDLNKAIADVIKCPVCFESFDENGKKSPRLLQCNHTICENCIGILANHSGVRCGLCRHVSELGVYAKELTTHELAKHIRATFPCNNAINVLTDCSKESNCNRFSLDELCIIDDHKKLVEACEVMDAKKNELLELQSDARLNYAQWPNFFLKFKASLVNAEKAIQDTIQSRIEDILEARAKVEILLQQLDTMKKKLECTEPPPKDYKDQMYEYLAQVEQIKTNDFQSLRKQNIVKIKGSHEIHILEKEYKRGDIVYWTDSEDEEN